MPESPCHCSADCIPQQKGKNPWECPLASLSEENVLLFQVKSHIHCKVQPRDCTITRARLQINLSSLCVVSAQPSETKPTNDPDKSFSTRLWIQPAHHQPWEEANTGGGRKQDPSYLFRNWRRAGNALKQHLPTAMCYNRSTTVMLQ